jgi:hypothetical protein
MSCCIAIDIQDIGFGCRFDDLTDHGYILVQRVYKFVVQEVRFAAASKSKQRVLLVQG